MSPTTCHWVSLLSTVLTVCLLAIVLSAPALAGDSAVSPGIMTPMSSQSQPLSVPHQHKLRKFMTKKSLILSEQIAQITNSVDAGNGLSVGSPPYPCTFKVQTATFIQWDCMVENRAQFTVTAAPPSPLYPLSGNVATLTIRCGGTVAAPTGCSQFNQLGKTTVVWHPNYPGTGPRPFLQITTPAPNQLDCPNYPGCRIWYG